jgi:hypothetical protein
MAPNTGVGQLQGDPAVPGSSRAQSGSPPEFGCPPVPLAFD